MSGFFSEWSKKVRSELSKKTTGKVVYMPHVTPLGGKIVFNDESAEFRIEFKPGQSFTIKK